MGIFEVVWGLNGGGMEEDGKEGGIFGVVVGGS